SITVQEGLITTVVATL
nr:immunoglobulin heavy chain junction region [Mus musculus]